MSADDVITLSSDSECEIVESGEENKKRNSAVLSGLKAQLSQIRGFTPQKKPSTGADDDSNNTNPLGNKAVNGNRFGASTSGSSISTVKGEASTSVSEDVVYLDDDDIDDFEIEYGDKDEKRVVDVERKSGSGDEDDELQVLDSPVKQNGTETRDNKNASSPVESVELEEDDSSSSVDDYVAQSEELVKAFGIEFAQCRKAPATKAQIEKAKNKVWESYSALQSMSMPVHVRLQEDLKTAIEELKVSPKNYWKTIKNLLEKMDPQEMTKLAEVPLSVRKQAQEKKKQALLLQAEKHLQKLHKKIQEYEEMEVDWDDLENDHNSAYMLEEKAKKKLVEAYYRICDISKCSHLTGRPIQKSIRLKKHGASSNYEDVDTAVENFVNKGGFLFIPDYMDVLTIVRNVNQSKALGLNAEAESILAQKVFENVVNIIKKRRQKDFSMSMLCHLPEIRQKEPETTENDEFDEEDHKIPDPAEKDLELKRKLEENETKRRTEKEVLELFARRAQNEGSQAIEVSVEGNPNGSPSPSDTENGEAENEDEGSDEEDEGGDSFAHQQEELTEDEDDEEETIRINIPPLDTVEEDDTSNEGRTTAAESESDTNTNVGDGIDEVLNYNDGNKDEENRKRKSSDIAEPLLEMVPENSEVPALKKMKSDENSNESVHIDSTTNEKLSNDDVSENNV